MAWIKQIGRAQRVAVPTGKPDPAEMRRIQATIRECSQLAINHLG
jgi:hypothetical protein